MSGPASRPLSQSLASLSPKSLLLLSRDMILS